MTRAFLCPLEEAVINKASCSFMGTAFADMMAGMCYQAIPAVVTAFWGFFYSVLAHVLAMGVLKWLWRYTRDNIELKRKRRALGIQKVDKHMAQGKTFDQAMKHVDGDTRALILDKNKIGEEGPVKFMRKKMGLREPAPKVWKRSLKKLKAVAAFTGGWKEMGKRIDRADAMKGLERNTKGMKQGHKTYEAMKDKQEDASNSEAEIHSGSEVWSDLGSSEDSYVSSGTDEEGRKYHHHHTHHQGVGYYENSSSDEESRQTHKHHGHGQVIKHKGTEKHVHHGKHVHHEKHVHQGTEKHGHQRTE